MADRAYTLDNPQTLQEFLAKYKDAISPDGKFIHGKANLNYDDLDASTVFQQLMGGYTIPGYTDNGQPYEGPGTVIDPAASANADWIEDPRAKGWIGQHPAGAAIAATVLGGVGANMMGLLGGSGTAGTASTAFGGPGSFAGANAVGAGDLALGAMPQVTAGTVGLTGAELAGLGTAGTAATLPSTAGTVAGLGGKVASGIKGLNDAVGGNLGAIAGGLLGAAAGGDTTTSATSQKDPWKPAQPYLLDNLKKNAAMQEQYAQNPFNSAQKTAYQNSFNASDNFRNNVAPGLLNMVNSFQPYQRQQTAVGGGYKPAAQTGLLSPNMQAPQGQSIGNIDWSQFLPRG